MTSFRDKYRLWRKRVLPASKADVARLHDSLRQELSELNYSFKTKNETLEKIVSKLTYSKSQELFDGNEKACLEFSFSELSHAVPEPEFVAHSKWMSYLSRNFNKPGVRILEIGSRNVTGGVSRKPFSDANYVGFDFYDGENVDVVGDAHRLSSYFRGNQQFDLIFSSAVFEHFHMPWVVSQEIQKLLKLGGYVFVETHFSFSSHERPWNFFQFSDMGLRALFNKALGFELVDGGMSNRMNGVFSQDSDEYLKGKPINELYCHSEILCKKVRDVPYFDWGKVDIDEIVNNTRYPPPQRSTQSNLEN